jgi:hypothetical protein
MLSPPRNSSYDRAVPVFPKETAVLNAFLVLFFAHAEERVDTALEVVAWRRLEARGGIARRNDDGHVVEAQLHNPKVMLTDDDLDDVVRLRWCRKLHVGGSTTPLGLLRLFPMKWLKELHAYGEQFSRESTGPFRINRPDVDVSMWRFAKP